MPLGGHFRRNSDVLDFDLFIQHREKPEENCQKVIHSVF